MTHKDTIKNAAVGIAGRLRMMEQDWKYNDQDRAYLHTCLRTIINCADCQIESGCALRAFYRWIKKWVNKTLRRNGK